MGNNYINLDTLRAESKKVQFLKKKFEVGYIPSGLAIPLLDNHNENLKTQKEDDPQEKIMQDEIRSVSVFCSFYEPEFTEEYISKNASPDQVDAFYKIIVYAIVDNFLKSQDTNAGEGKDSEESSSEKKTTGEK